MSWELAASIEELGRGPVVFKRSPKQIAVVKVGERVFAIDNHCPHEGYPLAEGTVDENCLLTCNWHNWKFRLSDGQCVLGGDNVRSYPVKVDDGSVWVDLSDPPREETERWIIDGLKTAFDDRDFERICREITRLHYREIDPLLAVRKAIEWSHDRLEFGFTHAYAAAADWLTTARHADVDWERQLICLAEAVDHMAFDALRHPLYPYAEPGESFTRDALLAAIEQEDRERAEGIVRRALEDGLHWPDLEETFAEAALAHYNDFGHSLIYVYKLSHLLDLMGPQLEEPLTLALTRSICYATREDLLPEFKEYATALADLLQPQPSGDGTFNAEDIFPASLREAFRWLSENIAALSVHTTYDVLLELSARNMLYFDTSYGSAYNRSVSQNIGWLDFTHGITFANAVRSLCTKYPRLWRQGLLQMACFVGRNRSFLDKKLDEQPWHVADPSEFFAGIHERLLDHGCRDPIFSAHLLKTTIAVEEELTDASPSCRKYLLAALNRFLNSPIKQKHVRRLARQAIALVSRDFADPAK